MAEKLAVFFLILSVAIPAAAQTVVVVPQTVEYVRPSPKTGGAPDFTVVYPRIRGVGRRKAARIERSLGFKLNGLFDLRAELGESTWLEEAGFTVAYNRRGVLNVYLFASGVAASPTYLSRSVVVDLRSGRRVRPAEVFRDLDGLAARLKTLQTAEIRAVIEELRRQPDYGLDAPERLFRWADFTAADLDGFAVGDAGVTFAYDYGFPRLLEPVEPAGSYFLSWREIAPFIRRTGLLGRFVR